MSEEATLDEFTEQHQSDSTDSGELREDGFLTLPRDWSISKLAEVAKDGGLVDGDWIESDDMDEDGRTQLVQLGHIGQGQFKSEPNRFITDEFAEEENCTMLSEDDLLISRMQEPILRSCLLPSFERDSVMAVDIARLQETEDWNRQFLKHVLNSRPIWKQGIAWASGTTRKRISRKNMEKLRIPAPSLSEQRKIATVLYTVDQAIEKTEKITQQAGRVRVATEQELFQGGYLHHDQIEERRLVEYPTDWNFEQLSDHTVESAFGPRYDSEKYDEGGRIATLRTTDLDRRGNITHETMPRADLDIREFDDHLLEEGDLIVSRSGAYSGITTTWDTYEIPTIPGAYMIRFRLKNSLNPEYLRYYFNSNVGRSRIDRRKKGSGQQNIAGSDLLNMRIPIPSKKEQEKIVEVIDSIESQILFNKNYRDRLERLKQGLMQDLLSGTVRTTDTNIEVPEEIAQYG